MGVQQARRVTHEKHRNDIFLDAWREQVDQALRGQEAGVGLARETADAYVDFLDSIFLYYGENVRAAEKGSREG